MGQHREREQRERRKLFERTEKQRRRKKRIQQAKGEVRNVSDSGDPKD